LRVERNLVGSISKLELALLALSKAVASSYELLFEVLDAKRCRLGGGQRAQRDRLVAVGACDRYGVHRVSPF
jgi:hypothetical protein